MSVSLHSIATLQYAAKLGIINDKNKNITHEKKKPSMNLRFENAW